MKKSRILAGRHGHAFKGAGVGFAAAGILSVCLALSHITFADSVISIPTDVQSEPVVSDSNALEQGAVSFTADEPKAVDANGESPKEWRVVRMRVTAYCPCSQCCGEYADGVTANNHRIQDGDRFVAADRTYAFGTEMVIPGYNNSQSVQVKDRGGAIQGDRLDVFFNTHQEALEWGVQYLDVRIKTS